MTPPPRAVNQPQPVLRREAGPPVAPAPSRRGSGAKWTGVAAAAKDCEPAQVSTYSHYGIHPIYTGTNMRQNNFCYMKAHF